MLCVVVVCGLGSYLFEVVFSNDMFVVELDIFDVWISSCIGVCQWYIVGDFGSGDLVLWVVFVVFVLVGLE